MSEKKKVINVKDLVIRAENVYLDTDSNHKPKRRHDWNQGHFRGQEDQGEYEGNNGEHEQENHSGHDQNQNHDPFFGFFRGRRTEEESPEIEQEHHKMESSENRDHKDNRGPFSWV